ncbi:MAG: SET domain-containing protein-lysine N-methyltransferase [Steroidobacteraceae bacterium]
MAARKKKQPKVAPPADQPNPWYVVRNSKIHGKGVFAKKFIPKGTRITEYVGDRISHKAADERYEGHDPNDNHTFLFIVDRKTVIDGGFEGNDARFINHSCDGNCESEIEKSRVYIEAIKNIEKGEELGYDYQIGRSKEDPENVDEIYACRCGAAKCRGTMLWPAKRPKPRKKKKAAAKKRAGKKGKATRKVAKKSKSKAKAKKRAKKSASRGR